MSGIDVTVYLAVNGELSKREFHMIEEMSQIESGKDLFRITHGDSVSLFNMKYVCEVEVRMVRS